jgi:hypothetical protein
VAYTKNSNAGWLFSEPVRLAGGIDFEHFLIKLKGSIQADSAEAITSTFFKALAEEIIVTRRDLTLKTESHEQRQPLYRRDRFSPTWQEGHAERAEIRAERIESQTREQFLLLLNRYPLPAAVGYMARFYLDCELIIVGRD